MAPSWVPQNIQKRIFRYILSRLEVFSNLDLSNLDVSVGTKTSLTLRDVQLDTEKISLPNGVFVRNGKLGVLNLSIGVGNGVEIDGNDLDFTVSLSSNSLAEDDLTDLLSRTTADLAESLIGDGSGQGDGSESDSDSVTSGVGYGFGEFPNMLSKVADAALSQVTLKLNDVKLRLVVDEELKMDFLVSRVEFSTDKNTRRLKVYEVEIKTPYENDREQEGEQDHQEQAQDIDDNASDDQFHEMQNSLMQSTLFSHEQASTMYMSAMSSMIQNVPEESSVRLLYCDDVDIYFEGLLESGFRFDIGQVMLTTSPLSKVLNRVIHFVYKFEQNSRKSQSQSQTKRSGDENEEKASFSISGNVQGVYLSTSKLLPKGLFESDSIQLEMTELYISLGTFLPYFSISDIILKKSSRIFSFTKPASSNENDLKCFFGDKITLLLPFPALIDVDFETIAEIYKTILPFLSVKLPTQQPIPSTPPSTPPPISAKFNSIKININTGSTLITISIFPSTFENYQLNLDYIGLSIDSKRIENGTIGFEDIQFNAGGDLTTSIKSIDSADNVIANVLNRLKVSIVKVILNQDLVDVLIRDFKKLSASIGTASIGTVTVSSTPVKQVRINEQLITFSTFISKVDCEFTFSKSTIGKFNIDCGNIELNLLSTSTQISLSTIFISRDFSDMDPHLSHIPLVYNANPSQKVSRMI